MTPLEIETATFRLVALGLNQLRNRALLNLKMSQFSTLHAI
jgi:hypothetical protein